MYHYKATTYEQMEKTTPKDKKFKQNAYEEIRKLVDDNEGNDIVKEVKKRKIIKKIHIVLNYSIKYSFSIIFN